ncbi:KIR protein [Plasmodium coatneyi]|uniref:KIR protein n=1 Tax=Plasmodium coatneyi TaxID=208452 RepID=A0A1B1E0V9_9APIC|nr:KIR protein [Plasmodium coatneyi]ANQ08671.1 KIR protein [Plasmodium coatneyi]
MAEKTCKLGSITDTLAIYNEFYTNFKNAVGGQGDRSTDVTKLHTALSSNFSQCKKIIADAAKNANAYEDACMQNNSAQSNSIPCRSFYYWFGHKYWSHLNRKTLSEVLKVIYETLGTSSFSSGNKCEFKYKDLEDHTIFRNMKIIFDYYHGYKNVPNLLSTSGITCLKEWSNYWTTLSSACKAMEEKCTGDNDHKGKPYCTDFEKTYAIHCDMAELQQKMDVLITKIQREAQKTLSKASTTSSLSSILGTLATIGTPFLLYKYKPWSSLFGNHSSENGGGRRKKGSSRRQQFDELTETSTMDLTDSSETSSTFDPNTVPSSTAYNTRQPSKGRTNNNSTPGHHHQRTNVGYGLILNNHIRKEYSQRGCGKRS